MTKTLSIKDSNSPGATCASRRLALSAGVLFAASAFAVSTSVIAETGSEDPHAAGLALAQRMFDRPSGRDLAVRATMVLVEPEHDPRVREYYMFNYDQGDDLRSLMRFSSPPDVAGVGLLVHNHPTGGSEQWLFLPVGERVRRISPARRGGRFVASDLYYEDLQDRRPEMDRHKLKGETELNGTKTLVLESIPVDSSNSVYSKRVTWVHPTTLLPLRIDFYEEGRDEPSKRWETHRIERIQSYWTNMDFSVTDLRTGHQSRLTVKDIVYDQDIPLSFFTEPTLLDSELEVQYRPPAQ